MLGDFLLSMLHMENIEKCEETKIIFKRQLALPLSYTLKPRGRSRWEPTYRHQLTFFVMMSHQIVITGKEEDLSIVGNGKTRRCKSR